MNQYDPIPYWKQEGKSYYDNFQYNTDYAMQELVLSGYLKYIKFNSVLELGAGFGRITDIINEKFNPNTYVAVDVSPEQLSHISNATIVLSDIESFKTKEKFDLVIAVEVLMHQLPDKVQAIIDKMKSLSNKHVISIDYYSYEKVVELAPHCFNHDYPFLYGNVEMIPIGKQALFHWSKTK